ncbi:gliding motility-associated-like protein [Pontibacter aydingkolensis]|uniref:FG-GAP-like repeat-containing protein n=1 Tax=Pontibacter aydingkolensis TaxID=1911536 RepID=A0ABS7CUF2_9BACT|nr:FG-GAP-like repeat-containing protein [Pontibacter aydingkolensis]MBW7467452.1 FG-GAP-like repeat-containing protein [Pontibacter aydingkolensis]
MAQQYTANFSTPPTFYEGFWAGAKTHATVNLGGVDYDITIGQVTNWSHSSSGGESNSGSITAIGGGDVSVTLKRKDNQRFQFYGVWLKYTNYSGYANKDLRVTYSGSTDPQQTFGGNSTAVLSKNVNVTSVSLYFGGLDRLYLDNLIVGPAVASLPTLVTNSVSNINSTFATAGGNITSDGGGPITERGLVWSTATNPTTGDNKLAIGSGTGSFSGQITNLTANTTYYVRAYAINSAGTAYGSQVSFTTTDASGPFSLTPTLDTSFDNTGSYPNENTCYVGYEPSWGQMTAALKFALTPISGTVTSAKLRLFVNYKSGTNPFIKVWSSANESWTASISSAPATNQALGQVDATAVNSWIEVDVTDYVKAQVAGSKIASLVVTGNTSSSPGEVYFNSMESTTNQPLLVVTTGAALSSNADLSGITLSTGTLAPTFATGTTSYTATVANGVSTIDITPALADVKAAIKVNGNSVASGSASNVPLVVGNNAITILVTAEDGTTKTYTVNVTRLNPSVPASAISFNGFNQYINVPNNSAFEYGTGTVEVWVKPDWTPGTKGANPCVLSMRADAGGATRYSLHINDNLGAIGIYNGSYATLPYSFAKGQWYHIAVVMKATGNEYFVNGVSIGSTNNPIATGVTGLNFKVGASEISASSAYTKEFFLGEMDDIRVWNTMRTASQIASSYQNELTVPATGLVAYYKIDAGITADGNKFAKAATDHSGNNYNGTVVNYFNDADLKGLAISAGTLSPAFATLTTGYSATVPSTASSINVTPTTSDSKATVNINSVAAASGSTTPVNLAFGSNAVNVKVTAQDGTIKTYTINVTRQLSSNADLSNLAVSAGVITPAFASGTTSYSVSLPSGTTSLNLTPTVADANATVKVNGTDVASGSAHSVTLNTGNNAITIAITAQNGTTKSYTLTANVNNTPKPIAGYLNGLKFDGVNDYVEIPSQTSNQFDSNTEFTVSMWYKANSMAAAGLFNRPSGGGDMQLWFTAENGKFTFAIDKHGWGWRWLTSTDAYKVGEWVQVSIVRRNVSGQRNMEIYANGVLVGSASLAYTSSASSAPIRIGTFMNVDGGFANGQIDNVSLWKKALTVEEIKTLGTSTLNGNEASLAGYWRFDETTGTIAYDATANANHGTLINMDLAAARVASTAGDITTNEDVVFTGKLAGSDESGNTLTYSVVTAPAKGALVITDVATGAFTYTPAANIHGSDVFTYKVNNGSLDSDAATVNVNIVSVNDAPVAVAKTVTATVDANCQAVVDASAFDNGSSDVDGDELTYSISPAGPFTVGTTNVTLTVSDGKGGTSTAATTITVVDNIKPRFGNMVGNPVASNTSSQPGVFMKKADVWHGPSPYDHHQVAAADFDGDGDLDLAYTTNNSPAIYLNDGKGVMTAGFSISNFRPGSVVTGDLNGDGKPDIIYGASASGTPSSRVYMNNGDGTFTITQSNVGGVDRVTDVALADLDGDGDLDVFFVGSGYSNRNHRVYFNDGNGNLSPSSQLFNTNDWGARVVLRDFNGDGTIDAFVTADWPENSSRLWINNGSGQFSASGPSFVNGYGIDAADFDKDGDMDIIYATSNTTFAFLINNGTGSFTQSTQVFSNPEGHKPMDVKFADIDNDNDADIIVGYSASPRIYLNDGSGQYSLGNTIPIQYSAVLKHMIFVDMDGDQDLDFVDAMAGAFNEVVFNQLTHPVTGGCSDIVVNNTPGQCGAVVTFTNAFSDNCPGATVAYSHASGSFFPIGVTTVTGEVTDAAGNKTTCSFTVTVADTEKPIVKTKAITVELDATGAATITPAMVNNGSTDNCSIASDGYSLDKTSFSCADLGDKTVSLTVTDVNGNTAMATVIVTVVDNVKPTAVAKNITVYLDGNGAATITAAQVNNGSTDACGIASVAIDKTIFSCVDLGANTVTLTVTDNNGNTATATATVTVEDNIAPVAKAQNITVQLNANGTATIAAADIDNGSTDNCGIASLALSKTTFGCAEVGANTVTLTVTDNSGNTHTATATVTVEDNIPPVAMAQNITVQLDASGNATVMAEQINNGSGDNCGVASFALSKTTFDCSNVGDNTVTLTVTDKSGNTHSATAIVTVEDKVAPTVVTKNITVQLDAIGKATITPDMINNGSTDNCAIASITLDKTEFTCINSAANTVTLTVTDVNGNRSSATAIVTVVDNIAPVAKAKNITVQINASGNATIAASDVDNGSGDNCGVASITLDKSSFDCSNTGANTVMLTVTDNSGNTHTATTIVTVEDKIAPSITAPANVVVDVDPGKNTASNVALGTPVTADNCSVASVTNDAPAVFPTGVTTVTWTVTDASGNTSTTTQTVTVRRDVVSVATPATINVPIRTAYAAVPLPATVTVTYSDGKTEVIGVTWTQGTYNGTVAGNYVLNGQLALTAGTTNTGGKVAKITVVVEPNKVPTALAFSATTFKPDAKADDVIGTLTTTDPDDTQFVYTLVAGTGDADNSLFEIRGDKVYLKSNNGLSGQTQFTFRVRSTDPYQNTIEKAFTLSKGNYGVAEDKLKIVNAFSPNNDGINDNWFIPELRFYNSVEVEVFDRSGVRLFHTTDPEKGWDGRGLNGQVLKGAFFYIVQVKDINLVKKGVVTIISK